MIKKYIKKPIPIEAVQFTGDNGVWIQQNFCPKFKGKLQMWTDPTEKLDTVVQQMFSCWIETLQGNMAVKVGDYVIKGIRGQFYSCDRDIFRESYDQC